MIVFTESGTRYQFNPDLSQVRRLGSDSMRQDGLWLRMFSKPTIAVGERMMLALEPLAQETSITFRTTSPVTRIVTDEEMGEVVTDWLKTLPVGQNQES